MATSGQLGHSIPGLQHTLCNTKPRKTKPPQDEPPHPMSNAAVLHAPTHASSHAHDPLRALEDELLAMPPGSKPLAIAAWLAVGIPLAWGVWVTLQKTAVLFH